jgi:integrase
MKTLHRAVRDYVELRQSLGYKFTTEGWVLREFARYMAKHRSSRITPAVVLRFVQLRPASQRATLAHRFSTLRGFALHHRAHGDPRTEPPAEGLIPGCSRRARPRLASEEEILRLLQAARQYRTSKRLLPPLYYCLFGLLTVTGMRIGEALRLEEKDIDWANGVLTVRQAKFGQDRLIPLHASTLARLRGYLAVRARLLGVARRKSPRLFLASCGTPLSYRGVWYVYRRVCQAAGLGAMRLHDLRHRFAVESLRRWYREGAPIDRRLPVLSTYLGHASVVGTYWYLSGTPGLMAAASARLERRWAGGGR